MSLLLLPLEDLRDVRDVWPTGVNAGKCLFATAQPRIKSIGMKTGSTKEARHGRKGGAWAGLQWHIKTFSIGEYFRRVICSYSRHARSRGRQRGGAERRRHTARFCQLGARRQNALSPYLGSQGAHRRFPVPVLRAVALAKGNQSRRKVRDANRAVRGVDVLPPRPLCTHGVDLEVLGWELDFGSFACSNQYIHRCHVDRKSPGYYSTMLQTQEWPFRGFAQHGSSVRAPPLCSSLFTLEADWSGPIRLVVRISNNKGKDNQTSMSYCTDRPYNRATVCFPRVQKTAAANTIAHVHLFRTTALAFHVTAGMHTYRARSWPLGKS